MMAEVEANSVQPGDIQCVVIQPGHLHLTRTPSILQTILGSCVGVTFWCARLGAGALCHGVLPRCPRGTGVPDGYRYVDFSIRYLAEQFDALGASRYELEVKLFGGADVLPVSAARAHRATVGALNCRAAREVLEEEGLSVLASDLGGIRGRTIRFDSGTGEVLLQRLQALNGHPAKAHRRSSL
jgi:chemotaxis protein CheD